MKKKPIKSRQKSVSHPPDPNDLLEQAQEEVGHGELRQYAKVIATLRGKGFSFREIAEWLVKRGVSANHNSVYHVFNKHVHPAQVDEIEQRLEMESLEES